MAKMSDDTLLKHAIGAAVLDRLWLAEAYHGVGEVADGAKAIAARFEALAGKKLATLSPAESENARLCFIYAQQYEESRFDARVESGSKWKDDPKRRAESFREVRIRRWGKTRLEVLTEGCASVSVTELRDNLVVDSEPK